jgi:hypothetical protein
MRAQMRASIGGPTPTIKVSAVVASLQFCWKQAWLKKKTMKKRDGRNPAKSNCFFGHFLKTDKNFFLMISDFLFFLVRVFKLSATERPMSATQITLVDSSELRQWWMDYKKTKRSVYEWWDWDEKAMLDAVDKGEQHLATFLEGDEPKVLSGLSALKAVACIARKIIANGEGSSLREPLTMFLLILNHTLEAAAVERYCRESGFLRILATEDAPAFYDEESETPQTKDVLIATWNKQFTSHVGLTEQCLEVPCSFGECPLCLDRIEDQFITLKCCAKRVHRACYIQSIAATAFADNAKAVALEGGFLSCSLCTQMTHTSGKVTPAQ